MQLAVSGTVLRSCVAASLHGAWRHQLGWLAARRHPPHLVPKPAAPAWEQAGHLGRRGEQAAAGFSILHPCHGIRDVGFASHSPASDKLHPACCLLLSQCPPFGSLLFVTVDPPRLVGYHITCLSLNCGLRLLPSFEIRLQQLAGSSSLALIQEQLQLYCAKPWPQKHAAGGAGSTSGAGCSAAAGWKGSRSGAPAVMRPWLRYLPRYSAVVRCLRCTGARRPGAAGQLQLLPVWLQFPPFLQPQHLHPSGSGSDCQGKSGGAAWFARPPACLTAQPSSSNGAQTCSADGNASGGAGRPPFVLCCQHGCRQVRLDR